MKEKKKTKQKNKQTTTTTKKQEPKTKNKQTPQWLTNILLVFILNYDFLGGKKKEKRMHLTIVYNSSPNILFTIFTFLTISKSIPLKRYCACN